MFYPKTKSTAFINPSNDGIIAGTPMDNVTGIYHVDNVNLFNMPFGQLIYNLNMEYITSNGKVALRTRRGASLEADISNAVVGAGDLVVSATNKFVYIDSAGSLKYWDGNSIGDVASAPTMDVIYNHEFLMFGLKAAETLYGVNSISGLYKTTGLVPEYTSIKYQTSGADILADCMGYSNIGGILFTALGHRISYSNVQQTDASDTSNLEYFSLVANMFVNLSPDDGEGIKRIIDNGEITFFFKDTGIWALINASEAATDWFFPKCNADVGTKSPKTVLYGRYGNAPGFIYLGSDKTLRFFNGNIVRNAGKIPTLEGGDSITISEPFQVILDAIPDGHLDKCTAGYIERYYILNVVSDGGTEVDTTIIIDTAKLMQGITGPQPYWFTAYNLDYTNYVVRNNKLYGFHKNGYINQLFVSNKTNDEIPSRLAGIYSDDETVDLVTTIAIHWQCIYGWQKVSDREVSFYTGYLQWKSLINQPINVTVNSFSFGEDIPPLAIIPGSQVGAITPTAFPATYGIAVWGTSIFSDENLLHMSKNMNISSRGNHFSFGAYSSKLNSQATIYSIEPRFKRVSNSVMGRNI